MILKERGVLGRMERILIIDDDCEMRSMLCELLKREGYGVLSSQNGNEAMAECQSRDFDLAIVDIFMPEKDGIETIQEIRERFPDIKIIAISGDGNNQITSHYLEIALCCGANHTLTKPFRRKDILSTVHACLNRLYH